MDCCMCLTQPEAQAMNYGRALDGMDGCPATSEHSRSQACPACNRHKLARAHLGQVLAWPGCTAAEVTLLVAVTGCTGTWQAHVQHR